MNVSNKNDEDILKEIELLKSKLSHNQSNRNNDTNENPSSTVLVGDSPSKRRPTKSIPKSNTKSPSPPPKLNFKPEAPSKLLHSLSNLQKKDERRDENLKVVETLRFGIKKFKQQEETLQIYEPNSGFRMTERYISNEELDKYFETSYFIPPSVIYSVVQKPLDNNTCYELPITEDWISIGVLGQKSGVKHTKAQQTSEDTERKSKHFCTFKFIDFNHTRHGNSFLNLILFESDNKVEGNDGEIIYSGGSGGAYEHFWKLREGTIVALINPSILKPLVGRKDASQNILGMTLDNHLSLVVVGHSRDYGICEAMTKFGNQCTKWIDKRHGKVCDYHLETGVSNTRNKRAEFSSSTSGLGSSAKSNNWKSWKPTRGFEAGDRRKSGLLDEKYQGFQTAPTYCFKGVSINSNTELNSSGTYGREKEERLMRKRQRDENENVIKKLKIPTKKSKKDEKVNTEDEKPKRTVFRPDHIRKIGFNPIGSTGNEVIKPNKNDTIKDELIQSLKKRPAKSSENQISQASQGEKLVTLDSDSD